MEKNNSTNESLTYEETTFSGLLKISGFKVFINWSMLYALLLTAFLVSLVAVKDYNSFLVLADKLAPILLGASATILGIVLAALAVSISLFHESLLPILLREKLLQKYLFPFWKAVAMWGLIVILNLLIIVFTTIELNFMCTTERLFIFNTFLFIYSTFYTVRLTGLIIRLTLQRSQLNI